MPSDHEDAVLALQEGRLDDAEALCKAALQRDAGDGAAASLMGALVLKRNQPEHAREWLERARAAGQDDAMLHANLGEAYRRLGRLDEAFNSLKQAIQTDGRHPVPFFNMGWLMRALGNARNAEHFFRSALQLNPAMAGAHHALAELYREEEHWREALVEYAQALELDPGNALWRARLGTLQLQCGATREAANELERAAAERPLEANFLIDLARAEFELCREAEAQSSLARGQALRAGAPSAEASSRIIAARYETIQGWCERTHSDYVKLSSQSPLSPPPLQAFPPQAAANFTVGAPVAIEAFLIRAFGAEVLPRDFSVLAGRAFLVDGVVNVPHQYPFKGVHAHHSADDGRVLLSLPAARIEVERPCAILGGSGDHFAWMFEALPRLWALEQRPGGGELALIVPDGLSEERRALLQAMGVDPSRLVYLPDNSTLLARELHIPSLQTMGPWVSPVALQFVRRKLMRPGGLRSAGHARRRLYLTRRGLPAQLANEPELLPVLEKHGFESIDAAGLPALEVMALLSEAEALLAVDGDIMANLPVAPQGALVGAVVPNGVYDARSYFVSAQLGQRFFYLVGEAVFGSSASIEECDIVLAPERLEEFLALLR
ncbi:MAG TPA: tetratricopeptide repeat protein [Burkholderiales bacterium]|nr:tetratricopeptide repeat protein [Burkholderiales bacterium]